MKLVNTRDAAMRRIAELAGGIERKEGEVPEGIALFVALVRRRRCDYGRLARELIKVEPLPLPQHTALHFWTGR